MTKSTIIKDIIKKNMKKRKIISIAILLLLTLLTFSGCLSINGRVPVQFLHFSDDGSMLVSLTEFVHTTSGEGGHMLQIWDVKTGSELFSSLLDRTFFYYDDAFVYTSPDNDYLILKAFEKNYDNTCIFDWRNDEIVTNFSETFHDWSDDGKYLAMENSDHNIEIWNATSFEVVKKVNVTITQGQKMIFSPDGYELAFVKYNEKCLHIYNLSTNTISPLENSSFTFKNNTSPDLYFLQWSTDGTKVGVTYYRYFRTSGMIFIWDSQDGSILKDKKIKTLEIPIFSADFNYYATITYNLDAYNDDVNELLSVNETLTDTTLFTFDIGEIPKNYFLILDWSQRLNHIAIGNEDGIITILDGYSGEVVRTLKTPVFSMSPGT